MKFVSLFSTAIVLGAASALPSHELESRQSETGANVFIAPGPNDSRGPCPALNTLANHGYINRDGKNISVDTMIQGFRDGLGIDQSVISIAIDNAFSVCRNVTGEACGNLVNLTLLATPHMFEHDHSFSRQDFMMAYQEAPTNNVDFNETIFDTALDVLGGTDHMNFQQANQVRLQRESLALGNDKPGWFTPNRPVQETEVGFIFAIMGDFNLPNYFTEPQVRVSWWKFWFANQSFPEPLGWHKPDPVKSMDFVLSVSSRVLAQPITSTPSPLPSGAIGPQPSASNATILSATAMTDPGNGVTPKRRAAEPTANIFGRQAAPSPSTTLNPYFDRISPEEFGAISLSRAHAFAAYQASTSSAMVQYSATATVGN